MKVGDIIEDFEFEAYHEGEFIKKSLSDYTGKWVLLFFYPRDFTFVCPTEIKAFNAKYDEFLKEGCVIIGASTDSLHSHRAWFERDFDGIKFPVIADTSHNITNSFNILLENGDALRGTFLIDPTGVLQYMVVSNNDVGRSVEETLRVFKACKTEGLCPVEWKPGEKTLNSKE